MPICSPLPTLPVFYTFFRYFGHDMLLHPTFVHNSWNQLGLVWKLRGDPCVFPGSAIRLHGKLPYRLDFGRRDDEVGRPSLKFFAGQLWPVSIGRARLPRHARVAALPPLRSSRAPVSLAPCVDGTTKLRQVRRAYPEKQGATPCGHAYPGFGACFQRKP